MREEKSRVTCGFLEGEHGGLHFIFVDGLVVVERSSAETCGSRTVEVNLALYDTREIYVFHAVELVAKIKDEVRHASGNIECFGQDATMDREL